MKYRIYKRRKMDLGWLKGGVGCFQFTVGSFQFAAGSLQWAVSVPLHDIG